MTVDYYRKKGYTVKMVCAVLGIAPSAYYKNKKRVKPPKEKQDECLCSLINGYHATYDGILGYRRMTMFINHYNHTNFCKRYIHRLMTYMKIHSRIRCKKVNRKRSSPENIEDNILNRDFIAEEPNKKWLTDVTEFSIPCDRRKLFLSPILDLCDNIIVEFELSHSNNNQLVYRMFDRAIEKNPGAKPLFHSDRGFQYTSRYFKGKLEAAGMTQSMSRVGKCIDNGPMEGFFGALKSEMFYGKRFNSMEELKTKIIEYIKFYNEERLQEGLGNLSPMMYRRQVLGI
jgi:transposase InsO family protein